ncbi:branched-chain-amino-acid aminotransferase, mitochondrial isoform X1 [Vidua chalybeata]|uniref:branched-chain-amino-acid aminotransferase, mitochondrial isoform X1 n=1 Tax=Vidua chalybeata TaxID=81927 RepID=UPI0023A7DAC2|nr:branched-chain-amino-acid aminotransferase, mitochondrial isoform X1 [Vidua chalybeata]
MLTVEWSRAGGWGRPQIRPFQELRLHPASSALHYAVELFEGLKAFRGDDDKIRLFRPELNMERMQRSARRVCLPEFDGRELLECIRALVRLEGRWVPRDPRSSLYIRPALIGTEPALGVAPPGRALLFVLLCPVGPYFPSGFGPVRLLADPRHARAWPGGAGHCKLGGNYGPCLELQEAARARGCHQVLWLHGPERHLTEVGTMNLFVFWERPDGGLELVTPPLDGLILPGVTRQSLLELARQVSSRCARPPCPWAAFWGRCGGGGSGRCSGPAPPASSAPWGRSCTRTSCTRCPPWRTAPRWPGGSCGSSATSSTAASPARGPSPCDPPPKKEPAPDTPGGSRDPPKMHQKWGRGPDFPSPTLKSLSGGSQIPSPPKKKPLQTLFGRGGPQIPPSPSPAQPLPPRAIL